jgi:hypothetical protein
MSSLLCPIVRVRLPAASLSIDTRLRRAPSFRSIAPYLWVPSHRNRRDAENRKDLGLSIASFEPFGNVSVMAAFSRCISVAFSTLDVA